MIYKLKRFSSYLERSFAVVNPAVAKPTVPNANPAMQQGKGGGSLGGLVSMAVPAVVPTVVMGIANSRSSSGSSEEDTEQ